MCAALDTEVEAFRGRPLTAERYQYLWLDATYCEGGRVVSMACLVAVGVAANGERRVLGLELLCACQGLDLRKLAPGRALRRVHARVRRDVAFAPVARAFGVDLAAVERLLRTNDVLEAAGPVL
mgnify:CR=1 FL=1